MASKLQPFVIDGQKVWFEVDDLRQAGSGKTENTSPDSPAAVVGQLEQTDIARVLGAVIAPVRKALASVEPDEISVEVALGVKGEVGFFVAKSEGSASLKVTAKWKPRETGKS